MAPLPPPPCIQAWLLAKPIEQGSNMILTLFLNYCPYMRFELTSDAISALTTTPTQRCFDVACFDVLM